MTNILDKLLLKKLLGPLRANSHVITRLECRTVSRAMDKNKKISFFKSQSRGDSCIMTELNVKKRYSEMSFKRIFNNYPRVYDKWQQEGVTYIIQDLPENDFDEAIRLLVDHLCTDEVLCNISKLSEDPESVRGIAEFWRYYLDKKMSLGCYAEREGVKRLIGMNVCFVACEGESDDVEIVGESWKNVYEVIEYCDTSFNVFEYFGLDKVLEGLGLVIDRKYRGARLGARILAAREPLCRLNGIKASSTVFTGIASQKSAASCGFETVLEVFMRDLANLGLKYPRDDPRSVKVMARQYN